MSVIKLQIILFVASMFIAVGGRIGHRYINTDRPRGVSPLQRNPIEQLGPPGTAFAASYQCGIRGVNETLITPCKVDDIPCLSLTTEKFIANTYKGIPQFDIKAIDPQTIVSTVFTEPDLEMILHFKNLTTSGLKDLTFSNLKMDTVKQNVELTTNANINVEGEIITIQMIAKYNKFYGAFTLRGNVSSTAKYSYSLRTDYKSGAMYYEVGPGTAISQVLDEPEFRFGPELKELLNSDSIIKKISTDFLRQITEIAYDPVIHNIRAAAKILPATCFLIGV